MSTVLSKQVILVMKQPGNIRVLREAVAQVGLDGVGVSSEEELIEVLHHESSRRTALVDVTGFGREVWRLCEILQEHEVTFIVLSTARDKEIGDRSIIYGAASVLQKPVAKGALLKLIQNLDGR